MGLLCLCLCAGSSAQDADWRQVVEIEDRAALGRNLFWSGEYARAYDLFRELAQATEKSRFLYLNEAASCALAMGDHDAAEKCLREVALRLEVFIDNAREREAMSSFGREDAKIYRGDPYEQTACYTLLSLLFLDKGDYDNALAAAKSGLLCDSDILENSFGSDFTLLHLLESKYHKLRRSAGGEASIEAATEAFRLTHPSCQALVSEKLSLSALAKADARERRRAGVNLSDAALAQKIAEVDGKIEAHKETIETRPIDSLISGDYNTLIVLPQGRVPYKYRCGAGGHLIRFASKEMPYPVAEICVDGVRLKAEEVDFAGLADLGFQALTRGGRQMDAIMKGKVVYRQRTTSTGSTIAEIGNQVGGLAGLGVALAGGIIAGIGGSMTPEADTRCWQCLPRGISVYPLKLAAGEHEFRAQQYVYFKRVSPVVRRFVVPAQDGVRVLFAPPPFQEGYSEACTRAKLERRSNAGGSSVGVLLPPPLGLERIERFAPATPGGQIETFAPDLERLVQSAEQELARAGASVSPVNHGEVCTNRLSFVEGDRYALQISVGSKKVEGRRKEKRYSVNFGFETVAISDGAVLASFDVTGSCEGSRVRGGSDAFYRCAEDALRQLASEEKFRKLGK